MRNPVEMMKSGEPAETGSHAGGSTNTDMLSLLAAATEALGRAANQDDALALLQTHARNAAHADAAVLLLRDAGICLGVDAAWTSPAHFRYLATLADQAAQPGVSALLDDIDADKGMAPELAASAGVGSAALLALDLAGVPAAIGFFWRERHALTRTEAAALEVLVHAASAALERREFEDRLRKSEARFAALGDSLRQADQRKDEFLATLAHELRNPLAPISNVMYMLRHEGGRRRADRLLQIVERQVRHIVRLVDDLLEMSRITRGQIALRRAPLALADALAAAVETVRPQIESNRHRLDLQLPPQPLMVNGDMVRLTQIFANLLDNAARYTAPGGEIRLSAGIEGNAVAVTVADNGMGIAPELRTRIFDLFIRGQRGCGPGGLGVGLPMVKSLVELHGGEVDMHSAGPGAGSEFTVRLPLMDQTREGRN